MIIVFIYICFVCISNGMYENLKWLLITNISNSGCSSHPIAKVGVPHNNVRFFLYVGALLMHFLKKYACH